MLTLEQRIKALDNAKDKLDIAIGLVFEAGTEYDKVCPSVENKFYRLRWELEQTKERIKQFTAALRISEVTKEVKE